MSVCDMCGKESELFVASVEGTELNVCKSCSKHGKVLRKVKPKQKERPKKKTIKQKQEPIERIVPDYDKKVRDKREKLDLKQEELAKKINEKVSVIHKVETKELEPSISLAKKLEKFLNVELIEEYKEQQYQTKGTKSEEFTIGDFIKINK